MSPYWPYTDDFQARQDFFKSLIERFHSVGLFTEEDEDTPVAWCMQHPFGQPAHLYVTQEYRRRGFASLLMGHMCKCIQAEGLMPEAAVEWNNNHGRKLMKKLGFVEHEMYKFLSAGSSN